MKIRISVLIVSVFLAWNPREVRAEEDVAAKLTPRAIQTRIREHRMGDLIIKAPPGAEVRVEQLRHEFWFGTAISNSMVRTSFRGSMGSEDLRQYQKILAKHFNAAVHENAFKWHSCERAATSGFDYSTAEAIYQWCAENDISMRGHCIFWATDRYIQDWVKKLDNRALRQVVNRRAHDATSRFRGRIEEFDLNNELIFGDFYRRALGGGIIKEMAESAKRGNPNAVLYLNEQGALAGGNADKYVKLIRQTLDAGVPIEGIGCQGHFGGMFDPEHVQETLDRLGRFNLPIKITEYDLNSSDEQLKAKHLRTFYEICFAHPAVEGIMMWGFWEGAHWRPKAALWKRDWSETPAAKAYLDLVFNQWWTRQQGKANSEGIYKIRAFYGKYRITVNGKAKEMTLSKNKDR